MSDVRKEELDEIVLCLKKALADPELRKLNQRAVQAMVWHRQPAISGMMMRLRKDEDAVRRKVFVAMSELIYKFHEHTLTTSLARAGILNDDRVHAGSSLDKSGGCFEIFCLDAKERLYLILKSYGWLEEFFRLYPLHFFENSFQFVDRVPPKKLKAKVKVVGLGIGGAMAVSGLAKAGIDVVGFEKRNEAGPSSVGSRYQNASWRAYDVASKLLDEQAYEELIRYRQKFTVNYDDGTTGFMVSDRVQIILGHAIEQSIASAKRFGADLRFGTKNVIQSLDDSSDIVVLFTGAHTAEIFPEIKPEMKIIEWSDIDSDCKMWLRIKESEKKDFFCIRGGEVGAEKWHYTIESARNTVADIIRVRNCLESQYKRTMNKVGDDEAVKQKASAQFTAQMNQLDKVQKFMEETCNEDRRFDYIFTNAPTNEHNMSKRDEAAKDGSIVLEGGYNVEVKMASNSKFVAPSVLDKFKADLVVCGGDACVPPNPQAAYGATLACETAEMVVQLATGVGHINAILEEMKSLSEHVDTEWVEEVRRIKDVLSDYYNARGRAENYFQFIQTLICNLYSLPPFDG
eukprot:CAMPEP_0176135672 /NCGR_PEP_ID=MMETSP0120_2-20121206/68832_1 /TAXON_ID=160619 /ORGANISM="Kryptoperidinium foliaceum, Strain CCMP 1326" /LENGTH=571 /DNA_ID=CAMNT_0017471397 /DNA_START=87 /DNA_END=1802 /DNA_ORIENTATION=+